MSSNKSVLVIGSGGREHAICWKLAQSLHVQNIFCAPGSVGISSTDKVTIIDDLDIKDFSALAEWCKSKNIDLVIVGPEDPLANGLADVLNAAGIKCFGPNKAGARIEADKDYAKQFMVKYDIPTARYQSFTNATKAKEFINSAPYKALVVKAAGLAAGKGVIVAENQDEACKAVDEILGGKFGAAGNIVVIEELLEGEEVSVLAFTDGDTVQVMLPAQDHKRVGDGDTGPNTGGMGAYCPCPLISAEALDIVKHQVIERAVQGMRAEGIQYVGVLYAGMMLTADGPKTLEFNCRFGDPETQVILTLLDSDLYLIMMACTEGTLKDQDIKWKNGLTAVGVVMASKGYPETATKGCVIVGLSQVTSLPNHYVFHSGTARGANGTLVTNGGRVLLACAVAASPRAAAAAATAATAIVHFPGAHYRKDIAHKAFSKDGSMSYLSSGVDAGAAAALIRAAGPACATTFRAGVLNDITAPRAGLFHLAKLRSQHMRDPVLVQGTDGVGTKIKIAESMNKWDTIGVDLVAMCVNDIICAGAEPFAFMHYMACGHLDVPTATAILQGVAAACRDTGCALLGGETAEMPSMYEPGKYDLAGFAVGVVENDQTIPRSEEIKPGDIVIGLPSTGVHSNGYSLVQKIFKESGHSYHDIAPFSSEKKSFGEEMLTPTGLYVKQLLPALASGNVKALAHITGGGLLENIPRVLSSDVQVYLDAKKFTIPPIFGWLAAKGSISEFEMLRTFNCGVGMVIIVAPKNVDTVVAAMGSQARVMGDVRAMGMLGGHQVHVDGFKEAIEPLLAPFRAPQADHLPKQGLSYKDSGVDIEAGDSLVSLIKPLARSTTRAGVVGGLGGFGGSFRLRSMEQQYKDPVLVMATDGIGTKLKIAQAINQHSTVGVDLVAMCANDVLCHGAEPLTFLDYFACGSLDVSVARSVVSGIAEGCRQAMSALIGGETAEMPGMYSPGVYDIAGFSLGVVERSQILPRIQDIDVGDILIGLPSHGVHSNGFSLIHKLMKKLNYSLNDRAPFSREGLTFGEELIKPTRMYVRSVMPAIRGGHVKAVCVVAAGGLAGSVPRVLPSHVRARFNAHWWNIHPVFPWIAEAGGVAEDEMLSTYNCGIGAVLVVAPESQAAVMNCVRAHGAMVVGSLQARAHANSVHAPQVLVDNFCSALDFTRRLPLLPNKKVAVLASGNGSNLQSLLDATRDPEKCMCSQVVLVVSNKPNAYALQRAREAGIPTAVFNHKDYSSREEFDAAISATLESHKVELVCLAGYMRILSPGFVQRWRGRILNIHPSLLPRHPGLNAQKQALDASDKESGCTVHFVDEGMDTGAILIQERVPVLADDTASTLSERILQAEHRAYPRALRLLATGRVRLASDRTLMWTS